ncbi:sigma-70 family RNA polymerase sigma factor [uncultured Clostridium sp.]|uniref:RNA polymerase sigma factor n=1 Tax=uncultured Clostridium sp. TaxID=59620 RepID=UPI0028EEB39B|nr:sigma-70 family RNA polymerase sigma factor [uncultured Clostridium sp.]
MEDDLKLVQEVLNGNIDSFNIIVNKYELPILKFIYNMVKNKETAEDITQEVFITLYNKLYMYKDQYKFSNWIFQIAKNKSIDYMRKYKRVHESNIEEIKDIASKEVSPEEAAQFKETKKKVEAFINSLEEIDRQIILLRYSREEMTFSDISQILNISESSVKRRYYKARDKYKQYSSNNEERCRI